LIKASAKASADLVKFQMVYADDLAIPSYRHYHLFTSLEFNENQWLDLKNYANQFSIELCVDIFGEKSIEVANKIGIRHVKIHPTDINNEYILKQLNSENFIIYLGIGGAGLVEIKNAITKLSKVPKLVLVLGYQAYPTPNEHNQISRISTLRSMLNNSYTNLAYGFADHVVDDEKYSISLNAMAYACGATVFEKHLSLGKCVELEDFESSLQPDQFKIFAEGLRSAIGAFGNTKPQDDFGMSEYEAQYRNNIRRSWVSKKDFDIGYVLTSEDIEFKRSEEKQEEDLTIDNIIGKKLTKPVKKYHTFTLTDFDNGK
jgi:N,N'-diacetyllegionaminate synthase